MRGIAILLTFLLTLLAVPDVAAPRQAGTPTLAQSAAATEFNGVRYLHRWSKNGQHEYTPEGQTDLTRWKQMVTLIDKPGMNPYEASAWAVNLADGFEKSGMLISADRPSDTEYRVVGVMRAGEIVEANFARLMVFQGRAVMLMVQRRFYGQEASELADWMKDNTPLISAELLDWGPVPSVESLAALPQAK